MRVHACTRACVLRITTVAFDRCLFVFFFPHAHTYTHAHRQTGKLTNAIKTALGAKPAVLYRRAGINRWN